ncbi:hypothetical protein [Anaeromyxobacter paludicola]|uniref:hypothetical protein n=1 Tax=Anaeromyxobacter paludicola TaxID=2918171 RepID=UPI0020C0ADDA|nr:hypothetical protein [Anaeromyxobacter paludicola]
MAGILLVGFAIAVALYATAPPVEEDEDVLAWERSKRYQRQLEQIGGKAVVLTSELNDRVASLWEGKARACTTAVATLLVAGGYLLVRRAGRRGD